MTTIRTIIKQALRKIGAYDRESQPIAQDFKDCVDELNSLLSSWSTSGMTVLVNSQESFSLSSGVASYTIGPSATFNTTRPTRVAGAFIRSGDDDHPLKIISDNTYRRLIDKSTSGMPHALNYYASNPTGTVNLYYAPDAAYALHLDLVSPMSEVALGDLDTDIDLPALYREALVYNLALRVGPDFGAPTPQIVADLAMLSLKNIKSANAARLVTEAQVEPGVILRAYTGGDATC